MVQVTDFHLKDLNTSILFNPGVDLVARDIRKKINIGIERKPDETNMSLGVNLT